MFVEWLRDRVKLIKRTEGYLTDLGLGLVVIDDADVPEDHDQAATVIEIRDIDPSSQGRQILNADVEGVVEFAVPRGGDITNPKQLIHRAALDLSRALKVGERDWPRFVRSFEVGSVQLSGITDDEGSSLVIAQLAVRAGVTELFTPAVPPVPNPDPEPSPDPTPDP